MRLLKIVKIMGLILFSGFSGLIGAQKIKAADDSARFAVAPIYSKASLSRDGYFDLLLKPDERHKIAIQIVNQDQKQHSYQINLNGAYTSSDGVIAYDRKTTTISSSLDQNFNDLIASARERKVTVAAGKTRTVSFGLKMPTNQFNGQLMGGIRVIRTDSQSKTALTNRYSVAIPVVIRESTAKLKGEVVLKNVHYQLANTVGTLQLKLKNAQPWVLPQVKIAGEIVDRSRDRVVAKLSTRTIGLAPDSQFTLAVPLKSNLTAGKYQLRFLAKADATSQSWQGTKNFVVTSSQIVNKKQEKVSQLRLNWFLITGVIVIIVGTIIGILIIRKRR